MKSQLRINFVLLILAFSCSVRAFAQFSFSPIYNYDKAELKNQLNHIKTDSAKLNLLFSLAFGNNELVESPSYIDTTYIHQIITINEKYKLFNDQPFRTILKALREGAAANYNGEIILLTTAIDQFDEQNIEIVMLLIEARWIFNVANQQEEKLKFYAKKLTGYLQKSQYRNAAACYHCLAGYYAFKGDINSSINNYLKAGEQFQSFSHLWYMHEFIIVASKYNEWGNTEKSYDYLHKAQSVTNTSGKGNDMYGLLVNSMIIEYDLKHYQKSLTYNEQLSAEQDSVDQTNVLSYKVLNLLGLNRREEAWDILKKYKDDSGPSGLSRIIQNGSFDLDYAFYKYYLAINDMPNAEAYLLSIYEKSKTDKSIQNEVIYLKELSLLYGDQGKTDKAWQYALLYNRYTDSIQLRTNRFNIASYENEQKENEQNKKLALLQQQQAVQEATIGQRNKIIWISMIGLVAVLGSLGFIYRQLQINKRNLNSLKSTQSQLIQAEKMASLGELTAGIAHEIQNPLNFVNNFSEVNTELINELVEEVDKQNYDEVKLIAKDIKDNEEKINHHGKRADAIVKGMLQHSRSSSGAKEPTDINALCDEYLRLAYHGLRAKDKSFNATLATDFDQSVGHINIIPQDIGRVILNLITNAFYTVHAKALAEAGGANERTKLQAPGNQLTANGYKPAISVITKKINSQVEIKIIDNGNGIPEKILDKIFQPFFTTKPTGEGTGLGLSMSYDIVKAHAADLRVETKEGEGSTFTILLPIT